MADRTFVVRINLDDLGAQLVALEDDAECGAWLKGFQAGANGAPSRDAWSDAKRLGWSFGVSARDEAEAFRSKKAGAGHASAEARRSRTGSAQPNTARTLLEHCSNTTPNTARTEPRTHAEQDSEQTPNQPTANSQQPITNNEHPTPQPPRGARVGRVQFSPGMFDHMIPVEFALSGEFVSCWHDWVQDRKARHKPVTEIGARDQLAKLVREAGDPTAAVSWIRESIANGWQGIFAPRNIGPGFARGRGVPSSRSFADQQYIEANRGIKNGAPIEYHNDPRLAGLD